MSVAPAANNSLLAGKTIIVAGGGIGGLVFALALRKQWPSSAGAKPKITIFERDSYADRVGREGYTLSLRTDAMGGGVQVLDKLGIYLKVREVSVQGQAEEVGKMCFWDSQWNELLSLKMEPAGPKKLKHMRIRRNALQKVLAEAVLENGDEIIWSSSVVDAGKAGDGKMQADLSDGRRLTCDLLIAADGSKSKIRGSLRPDNGLDFTGVAMCTGTAKFEDPSDVPKPFDKNWGPVLANNPVGLFIAPVDEHSVLWGFSYHVEKPVRSVRHPFEEAEYNETIGEAHEMAKGFGERVQKLVNATDPASMMKFSTMDRPPFPHNISLHGSVIWIGDANHAVSPFAGNGANMAMMDGWELAKVLCDVKTTSLEAALVSYDKMVIPRTTKTLKTSHFNISVFHASGWRYYMYRLLVGVVSVLPWLFIPGERKEKEE